MKYLSLLSEDEVRYVCSVIPMDAAITYFRSNPKDFAQVMSGFRVKSLKEKEVFELLFKYHNKRFISSFIENHISRWFEEINEHITQKINEGESREVALLKTFPFCYFADNIRLFLKLNEDEYSEEYIDLLSTASKTIKDYDVKSRDLTKALANIESQQKDINNEIEKLQEDIEKSETESNERSAEIKRLKNSMLEFENLKTDIQCKKEEIINLQSTLLDKDNAIQKVSEELAMVKENYHLLEVQTMNEHEKQQSVIQTKEEELVNLKSKILEQDSTIQKLTAELSENKGSRQLFENQIRAELEKQKSSYGSKQEVSLNPLCPVDIGEFKDFLGYNLESLGIPTNEDYFHLLKEHLSYTLFQGVPIVISRSTGMSLIKCVANTLIATQHVETLVFSSDISEQTIDDFLSEGGRIVCLDNFIGNFNETLLLPIFEKYRNKIIFLTAAYDRSLCFIPDEFLKYCYYLNLNRIEFLLGNPDLDEDPSIIEESELNNRIVTPDSKYSLILKEMLDEFGISRSISERRYALISNEQDLCCTMAFDVLPYCVDVLQFSPYNISERLAKYAGDEGRCAYKNLFKGWFS